MSFKGYNYFDNKPIEVLSKNGKISKINEVKFASGDDKLFIAPGFIDNQVNGYNDVNFMGVGLTVEKIKDTVAEFWKQGVTTFFPTLITSGHKQIIRNLKTFVEAQKDSEIASSIPGFHLEGPYISPVDGYRGAHPLEHVRLPNWEEFQQYIEAANNKIIQVTLAPEVEGAIPFIKKCVDEGIVVALGHHNGSAEDIKKATDAGAVLCTHLGNGCARNIDRAFNPLWAQLAEDRLNIQLICDGFHLEPEQVRTFYKTKGKDSIILTSDIVHIAGLPPGIYNFFGEEIEMTADGMVVNPKTKTFAGAGLPLKIGIENIMKFTNCSLADAVNMVTLNYTKLFPLSDRGKLAEEKRADIVIFEFKNNKIEIIKTIVAGKEVYSKK